MDHMAWSDHCRFCDTQPYSGGATRTISNNTPTNVAGGTPLLLNSSQAQVVFASLFCDQNTKSRPLKAPLQTQMFKLALGYKRPLSSVTAS